MPKELNISPNERIDFDDFEYGSRTFTVDSLRTHVSRLLSGGYRGGFVFEGFRVEIPTLATDMEVTIYNGICLDRGGRLITKEEGDFFLNNPLSGSTVNLLQHAPKNYIMIEYTLDSVDSKQRAFWDPTYPNSPVQDSAGNNVPQPKGKEFTISIPTRRAQSWTWYVSSTGFEDAVDSNKIRIPVAIIPVHTGLAQIDIPSADIDFASTSIIEKPKSRDAALTNLDIAYIQCANTRVFNDQGKIKIYRRDGMPRYFEVSGSGVAVTEIDYVQNDKENNILWLPPGIQVHTTAGLGEEPEITDVIKQTVKGAASLVAKKLIREGSQYDCRPMFFSVTEQDGSRQEDSNNWPVDPDGERRTDSRQFKYWSGLSLVSHPNPTVQTTQYPTTSFGQHTTKIAPPSRTETRMKQQQDFFRVVASLMEEMKYGYANPHEGAWSQDVIGSTILEQVGLIDTSGSLYLIHNGADFTSEYVGASIYIVSGHPSNINTRGTITKIYGNSVCRIVGPGGIDFPAPFSAGDEYRIELNYPNSLHKYVDAVDIGSLREVYNARVDQFTDTYAKDLNRRLSGNKVATITVGDGINTPGDYVYSTGLVAAIKQAYNSKRGATIYVRAGDYNISTDPGETLYIGPNTTIVGDGPGVTNIQINNGVAQQYCGLIIRDYDGNFALPLTSVSTASNITFKNLTLTGNSAFISNATLQQQSLPGIAGAGPWRTNWNLISNSPTYVSNLLFDNVHMVSEGASNSAIATGWSNPTAEDCSYAVYLVSDENNYLTYGNSEITFKNCKFESNGGALLLKSCKDVKITNCLFQSSATASLKTLEGITIASRCTDDFAGIPFFGSSATDGNIQISGCTFTGAMYDENSATTHPASNKRGWINFTPSYNGVNNSISNCQFQGYLLGDSDDVSDGFNFPRMHEGDPQIGTCIVKCSGPDLLVTGCNFGNYNVGVITQNGLTTIDSCRFFQVAKTTVIDQQLLAVTDNSWRYSEFGGASGGLATNWNYWAQMYSTPPEGGYLWWFYALKTEVKNCTFSGQKTGTSLPDIDVHGGCIAIHPVTMTPPGAPTATSLPRHTLTVDSCTFNDVWGVLSTQTLKPTDSLNLTGFQSNAWESVELSNSTFEGVKRIIHDSSAAWHPVGDVPNGTQRPYDDRGNQISNFVYRNNMHYNAKYTDSSLSRGYVAIGSGQIIATGNIFDYMRIDGVSPQAELNPICNFSVGARGLVFDNNNFLDCTPGQANAQITMLKVEIMSTRIASVGPAVVKTESISLEINNNSFSPGNNWIGAAGEACNGVMVTAAYQLDIPDLNAYQTNNILHTNQQEHFWPSLSFKNNDFYLINGNFGFVSIQHSELGWDPVGGNWTTGYANLWAWHGAVVNDNKIKLQVHDKLTNYQHGNDLYTPLDTAHHGAGGISVGKSPAASVTQVVGYHYSFLGASLGADPEFYYACVDLRRMGRIGQRLTPPSGDRRGGTCAVLNNHFEIANFCSDTTDLRNVDNDLTTTMGLRIAKFPMELQVSGNMFSTAPLVLKWSWNCPYFSTNAATFPANTMTNVIGYTMNINNNSFMGDQTCATVVDINPATGYGHEIGADGLQTVGYPTPSSGKWTNITFNDNVVKNGNECLATAYPYHAQVRFWFPNRHSWCANSQVFSTPHLYWLHPYDVPAAHSAAWILPDQPGGFGWSQFYASTALTVENNHLLNCIFLVTTSQNGGASFPTSSTLPVVFPALDNDGQSYELSVGGRVMLINAGGWPGASLATTCYQFLRFTGNHFAALRGGQVTLAGTLNIQLSIFGHTNLDPIGGLPAGHIPSFFPPGTGGQIAWNDNIYGKVFQNSAQIGTGGAQTLKITEIDGSGIGT